MTDEDREEKTEELLDILSRSKRLELRWFSFSYFYRAGSMGGLTHLIFLYRRVTKDELKILEFLRNLQVLEGFEAEDQSDPGYLDGLLASCQYLKKLSFFSTVNVLPSALFQRLSLRWLDVRGEIDVPIEDIIRLCENKPFGFILGSNDLFNKPNLDYFTRLIKACPHIYFWIQRVEVPYDFNIEEF
jgi:hypothetical protein